jgi:hypothetical protein
VIDVSDIAKIKCPACGMDDAYFTFEHGIGIGKDLGDGKFEHIDLAPAEMSLNTTRCRHCLADVLPNIEGVTLTITKDL